MCEPPESGKVFTGDNEESGGQIFSLKTIPWLPSSPSVGTNSERRSRWSQPLASQSSALHDEAVNRHSILLSFIRHSRVIRGSPCKNEQEHEHEYEFVPCIRLRSWLKTKISVDIFQRIPLKGHFTLSAIALAKADSGPPRE